MTDKKMLTGRTALVTGASAGIGAAFARLLAGHGATLLLVARRADRLQALASELTADHGVQCVVLDADLGTPGSATTLMEKVTGHGLAVDVLINNAGLSNKTPFADTPWPVLAAELQLMVTTPTELAHLVVSGMRDRRWGRVVNVSSVAAFAPPGASLLYTGEKSYVLAMSQALDMELKPAGVHVTALCPGFTRSEFHDAMGTRSQADRLPGFLWQSAEAVALEGWAAVTAGKPVCVPGLVNKVTAAAMKPIPTRLGYVIGRTLNPFKN
jgi:short-subunit dehydrogenase